MLCVVSKGAYRNKTAVKGKKMSKRMEIGEYVSVCCERQKVSCHGIIEAIGAGIIAIRTELGHKHTFPLQHALIERLGASIHVTNISRKQW